MKSIRDKASEWEADLAALPGWNEKHEWLLESAAGLPELPPEERTPRTRVKGCRSASWVDARLENGRLWYRGWSEAPLGRGVMSMLFDIINGQTPREIAAYDFDIVRKTGLESALTPVRRAGLHALIERIKKIANEYAHPSIR
ncbi:MAG: SufE family protein [Chlorobi bacterium]|nr:SufE family protein [Chlorobiota bacterium]